MMITIQRTEDAPFELVDESELVKSDTVFENDDEYTTAVEYRLVGGDRVVHRSVHVTLKRVPDDVMMAGVLGLIGGQ